MAEKRGALNKGQNEGSRLLRERIWELDFIRGLCVFLMIFDHMMFDLAYVFNDAWFPGGEGQGLLYYLCLLYTSPAWEEEAAQDTWNP